MILKYRGFRGITLKEKDGKYVITLFPVKTPHLPNPENQVTNVSLLPCEINTYPSLVEDDACLELTSSRNEMTRMTLHCALGDIDILLNRHELMDLFKCICEKF